MTDEILVCCKAVDRWRRIHHHSDTPGHTATAVRGDELVSGRRSRRNVEIGQRGNVCRIDRDGKRIALFDPAAFSQLALDRADGFSPASDGGMYQIAQSGGLKPRIYVLRFSSDGSASSP